MICKICKIPLKDYGQYLDMYGTKVKKEEFNCPNEDNHDIIIEKRLKKEPLECPICSNLKIDEEVQIFRNDKKISIIIDETCPNCRFNWVISSNNAEISFDEEQLTEYGEDE